MPMGFGLFSFDLLAAFRRHRCDDAGATLPDGPRPQVTDADGKKDDQDLQATAEQALWGPLYFPVL
ncbi:hypothetical protein SAMN05880582_10887 [Rhizobium sp. RU20A]|uniref:hypothetical protein n=1 Tax=Rhizobium sp. RU20A TaxID=1907412 RepID=UPI0009572D46|nr:hypothetical protein [Rhizobium sp. RU20A]SIR23225.1 hypothetical protein SAMN05880582_10887 [Rhizobium sp. RU20A]